jgi:hypothetical protein
MYHTDTKYAGSERMKEEEMNTVNMRINGHVIPLRVPPHLEPLYRDAEKMLDDRSLELKKEHEVNNLSNDTIYLLLAIEGVVDSLLLQKENEGFQEQIDKYLEMLGKFAA